MVEPKTPSFTETTHPQEFFHELGDYDNPKNENKSYKVLYGKEPDDDENERTNRF